jgi:hypothetical protein
MGSWGAGIGFIHAERAKWAWSGEAGSCGEEDGAYKWDRLGQKAEGGVGCDLLSFFKVLQQATRDVSKQHRVT